MDILIIGGTRFLGKLFAERLILSKEFNLTILSRNPIVNQFECETLNFEKKLGLEYLRGKHFSLVFDFLVYDEKDILDIKKNLNFSKYILISTTWIKKLNYSNSIDDLVIDLDKKSITKLSSTTKKYLLGKRSAENLLYKSYEEDKFHIIRLPIFFGEKDHTKRLSFYISRLLKNKPLIVINSGINICQIAYVEDLANILYLFSKQHNQVKTILNALPHSGLSVIDFIKTIKKTLNSNSKLIFVRETLLRKEFPKYLDLDPLWKEEYIEKGENNIFKFYNFQPTKTTDWIEKISKSLKNISSYSNEPQLQEINFVNQIIH